MRRSDLADRLREWSVAGGMDESQAQSLSNNAMIRRFAVRLGSPVLANDDEAVSWMVRESDTAEEFLDKITNFQSNITERRNGYSGIGC